MNNKFFTTYGIEFSYLVPEQFDKDMICSHSLDDLYVDMFAEEFNKKFRGRRFNHLEIHNDDVIEISGPYFSGYKDMKTFYKGIEEIATKLKTPTHREDSGGGGGHIHAGIPKDLKGDQLLLFIANVFRDINNRPYLNYIFNESIDDCNAYHMVYKYNWANSGRYSYNRTYMNPNITTFKELKSRYLSYTSRRGYDNVEEEILMEKQRIVRAFENAETYMNAQTDYNTLEFRIFDAICSEKQLKSHINFLNQYLRYIWAITKRGELVQCNFKSAKDAKKLCNSYKNPVKTRREFRALLKTLGLEYRNYQPLFKKNFLERIEIGSKFN